MDDINLSIPAKPEYILVARLTTSAIASRIDFCMNDIEDLKVAVAEACIILMNVEDSINKLNITFKIHEHKALTIDINLRDIPLYGDLKENEENELGLFILKSLMDTTEIKTKNNQVYGISMHKKCGG